MEPIFCAIHNKAMRQGKWGVSCPTPIEKDASGGVTKWCDYKPGKVISTPQPEIKREPIKERDFDAEARGKIRHGLTVAHIEHSGLTVPTREAKANINLWVEFIMSGEELF